MRRGISQAQLAYPNLSDSYISLIESGKRAPTPEVIDMIAGRLGCASSYLISGVDKETEAELRSTLIYAGIALENGEAEEARDRYAFVVGHADAARLPAVEQDARWGHALALEACGRLDRAAEEMRLVAGGLVVQKDPDRWAAVHVALCRCLRDLGELEAAVETGERGLEMLVAVVGRPTDSSVMLGAALLSVYLQLGDLAHAQNFAGRLIAQAESLGSPLALMAAYWNASVLAEARGEFAESLRLVERAAALLGEANDPRNLARIRIGHAHALLLAHPEEATRVRDLLSQAEKELATTAAGSVDFAWCRIDQARAAIVLGEFDEAVSLALQAIELLTGSRGLHMAEALTVLGDARMKKGERDQAIEALTQAATLLEQIPSPRLAAQAWYNLARVFGRAREGEREEIALRHALECVGLH